MQHVEKALVIVESPAKAKTIAGYLGKNCAVESSIGHIRDLPKKAADIPAAYKKEAWSRLGVNVDEGFEPLYVVDPDKKAHIKKLKELLKEADQLYLATDEDREGESIAWHLLQVLKPKIPVKRMVFHEITKKAIQKALENPREIDDRLVSAQEARRILDRLYGYEVSPVLWKKVMPRLSAGRVQSVATRVIVQRERERIDFISSTYWDLEGGFTSPQNKESFKAQLVELAERKLATGKDFNAQGKLTSEKAFVLGESDAKSLAKELIQKSFNVDSVQQKPYRRSPYAPFMTSTLQQEAGRKLRFSASRAMRAAQRLYENGFITYMRTDSTTLSDTAIDASRKQIKELYGNDYLPPQKRTYKNKVKNAQEAHEAIRPAGDVFKLPESIQGSVGPDEAKLYELIWKRTIASQMMDARGESVAVHLSTNSSMGKATFAVRGKTITFPGFLRAYVEGSDDPNAELEDKEQYVPQMKEGDAVSSDIFEPKKHETLPPARFTEASLVKKLEELGVGRPSTYASIIGTIQNRGYVWKKGSALVPTFTAFAVITLLEKHFPELVDFAFTARMENDLDEIAGGSKDMKPWLERFYFGREGRTSIPPAPGKDKTGVRMDLGLKAMVSNNLEEIDARAINSIPLGKDENGQDIIIRVGRYGPYVQRGEDTASIPEMMPPDELCIEKAIEYLNQPTGDEPIGTDPTTGLPVFAKGGRFGPYVQLGELDKDNKKEKPKTASLFSDMKLETITLQEALKLLSLPRTVGEDPADGIEIIAQNGRYGPYITKEKETRSLETEEQIFTVTVEEALKILAEPKKRGRRKAAPPLKELGDDPVSGKPMIVKTGRFGPYVTDGETIASIGRRSTVEDISPELGAELLQNKRDQKAAAGDEEPKKAAKKKTAKKKTAKKKTTKKKTTAEKSAVKKKAPSPMTARVIKRKKTNKTP